MRTVSWTGTSFTESKFVIERLENSDAAGQVAGKRVFLPGEQVALYRVQIETPALRPQSVDQESGFWLWEGARDLLQFLAQADTQCWCERLVKPHGELEVLELGCGHALPAIYLARERHCARVDFQDHSAHVLQEITQANVWRNAILERVQYPPRFYAGDWRTWLDTESPVDDQRYDLILASETVYSRASTLLCLQVCRRRLKPGGIALFAGKTVYFGLDGGMLELDDMLVELGGRTRLLWQSNTSISSYRREIRSVHF